MEWLVGYIATGIISLVVGILLQRFQDKPKLLYWIPGSFLFDIKEPIVQLRTDSLTIQNAGRKSATNVEIIYKNKPDHFQFSTPTSFTEEINPNGEYIIKIPYLGAKEFINIQLLSHIQVPFLLNVRCTEDPGQLIQVHLQRRFPKWFQISVGVPLLLGVGFAMYWIVKAMILISESIGIF